MRKRRTKEQIMKKILKSLSKKDLSINEIARDINANWSTVEETLKFMSNLRLVKEVISTPKIRIFRLTKNGRRV